MIIITVTIVVLMFIINRPGEAGSIVNQAFEWVTDTANAFIQFFSGIFV